MVKMNKKTITFFLCALSVNSFSYEIPEGHKKILEEYGLTIPGSGIQLVPRSALHLSSEQIKKGAKAEEERRTLGYAVVDTNRPMELLNFHNYAKTQFKLYATNERDQSTHLRKQVNDLKLAFKFKGVPEGNTLAAGGNITILGVAPKGGFHQDKGGWSGAGQFFDAKNIGSCAYSVMNVKASNTAARLAMEDVTYSVNNKVTISFVEGNKNSGFIYKVEWYDDITFHELECANMKYSEDMTKTVIALANQIDTYQ
jgi:hypothetical protein